MRTHLLSGPRRGWLAPAAASISVMALAGCLRNPSADVATAQALTEIADQLGAIQQDNAAMQGQIDSLRTVVARQDTVLRQVANVAGVPVPPR